MRGKGVPKGCQGAWMRGRERKRERTRGEEQLTAVEGKPKRDESKRRESGEA